MAKWLQVILILTVAAMLLALCGCPGSKGSQEQSGRDSQTSMGGQTRTADASDSEPAGQNGVSRSAAGEESPMKPPVTGYMPTPEQPLAPPAPPAAGAENVPEGNLALAASLTGSDGVQVKLEDGARVRAGENVKVQLTIVNNTPEKVEIVFANSQKLDVIITDLEGAEVYRWSEGMRFPEVVNSLELSPGQQWSHELTVYIGSGPRKLSPGTYNVKVIVTGTPQLELEAKRVTITTG